MKHFVDILMKLNLLSVAYAENIEDTPVKINSSISANSSNIGSILLFMIVFACITAILFFLFIVVTKRNEKQTKANKSVRVLDKINLDHNGNLFVIQIQDKIHILGKTDSNITPITEITDQDAIKILKSDCLNKQEITFQSVLTEQFSSVSKHANTLGKLNNNSTTSKAFKIQNKKEL